MSSLAKQILKNRNRPDKTDDLGIPILDDNDNDVRKRPQYFVARALILETKDPNYDPHSTHRMHIRHGEIYSGKQVISECRSNFYKLTGIYDKVPLETQLLFWVELKRRLPRLCSSIYKVSDELWWDKTNGKLIEGSIEDVQARVEAENRELL